VVRTVAWPNESSAKGPATLLLRGEPLEAWSMFIDRKDADPLLRKAIEGELEAACQQRRQ